MATVTQTTRVTETAPADEAKLACTPWRCACHLFSTAIARSTASKSAFTIGQQQRYRTKHRYNAAMAIASQILVQQSGARNSKVGYLSDGLIAHQMCVASGMAPEATRAEI